MGRLSIEKGKIFTNEVYFVGCWLCAIKTRRPTGAPMETVTHVDIFDHCRAGVLARLPTGGRSMYALAHNAMRAALLCTHRINLKRYLGAA